MQVVLADAFAECPCRAPLQGSLAVRACSCMHPVNPACVSSGVQTACPLTRSGTEPVGQRGAAWGSTSTASRVEIVRRALEFSACASAVSCGSTSGIHPWHVSRAWRGSAARRPRVLKLRAGVYRIRVCLGCMSILPPLPEM